MAKRSTTGKRLAQLLIDLAIDDEFRARFNQDRAAAIASRKLSKDEAEALMSNDSDTLQLLLNNQVQQAARRAVKARPSAKKRSMKKRSAKKR
jgi:uncharacterized protein YjgD (DUF1641 family)